MGSQDDRQSASIIEDDEHVDRSLAVTGEPIVGTDKVVFDEETGPGALAARPLTSPKGMSAHQRAIHDLTHLPYDPSCEICSSCRRPNTQHRSLPATVRAVPLVVGDYCFPKHSDETTPLTLLVIRVYPYRLFFCCAVPSKGRDPTVVHRLERFIRECGLTHFTYRSDREPAIQAMMEEAASMCGRNGVKDAAISEAAAIDHAQLVEDGKLAENPDVSDDPGESDAQVVESTHTAAPELSHPGESQSNGLAERSVGIFEDQFRTLKMALETKIKHRLPSSHPVTSWLVEHTAWVLNKFHLGSDGRTAYGRLHGREGRDRVCEFGETIMWFVPKKMRSKLDQRWRYGVFLGRALGSDQNFVGVNSGEVVCARAIIRVVPSIRWSSDRISKIHVSPLEFKVGSLDHIEEAADPHAHPQPEIEPPEDSRSSRRLRINDSDVRKYGFTRYCPRCQALRTNRAAHAKGLRHNEECREHIYDALRSAGAQKLKSADLVDPSRTQTRASKHDAKIDDRRIEDQPVVQDAPDTPIADMEDVREDVHVDMPPLIDDVDYDPPGMDDTADFYKEVDADPDLGANVGDVHDSDGDHFMNTVASILQTLGVNAVDATNYAVHAMKDRPISACEFARPCNPVLPS